MHIPTVRYWPVLVCAFLFACTPTPSTTPDPIAQGSGEISLQKHLSGSGENVETVGELPAEEAAIVEELTATGTVRIPERLLPSGILEIGDAAAKHTLLVVTEHHCRYCGDFQSEQFPRLQTEFLENGTLKLHIVILPIRKYAGSEDGAAALLCAAAEGRGLPMHELLLERDAFDASSLLAYARDLGIPETSFSTCMSNEGTRAVLRSQAAWLRSLHVTLVPTFFLDGERATGLPYYADLKGWIEEME